MLDADFNTTFFNRDQAALFQRLGVEKSIFEVIGAPIAETYPVFTARGVGEHLLARAAAAARW